MARLNGMIGKTCIVTGATGGIGRATARELTRMGAKVIAVGRNKERGQSLENEITNECAESSVEFVAADLSIQEEVNTLAADILLRFPRIDVLVNNAGGIFGKRQVSADGLEMTFALNHVGYFLLAHRLLPAILAASPARIINVASNAHFGAKIDFSDLQYENDYKGFAAYKRSKLANIYFTYELAKRLVDSGVTVNALHPGFVATEIGVRNRWTSKIAWSLLKIAAVDVATGAKTSVFLSSAPEVEASTGTYFDKCRPKPSSRVSYDENIAQRLWSITAGLCGLSTDIA